MATNLTNLLPENQARAFRQGYFIRLAALGALLLAFLIAAHGALLIPTYLYATEQEGLARARLAEISASLASSEEEEMSARLTALSGDATRLLGFANAPSSSDVFKALLVVARPGISIEGLTYSPAREEGADARAVITGVAASRESLRAFHGALSALPGVTKADLPLSAYAKETDIAFAITLTGPLSP